jgi:hypothetical protein
MPELGHVVDDVVLALEDHLKAPAAMVAAHLRNAGRVVDLVLATKRLKWCVHGFLPNLFWCLLFWRKEIKCIWFCFAKSMQKIIEVCLVFCYSNASRIFGPTS